MQDAQDLCFGPYRLDLRTTRLWRGQESVKLTPKALSVLCLLVSRAEQVVTKDELFQTVWSDVVVGDDALTSCIQELRRTLGDDARQPRYIETVHRRGFRFIGKVVSEQSSVVSQDKVVSSQYPVVSSQQEEKQKRQEIETEKITTEIEKDTKKTEYVDAGPRTPDAGLLSQDSVLSTQVLSSPPTHFWSRKVITLAVVLLVASGILAFLYPSFFSLHIQQTKIRTQGETPLPLSLPDKPSIIVLPFVNLSGDQSQEYLGDGITEEITATLSRSSSLFVISRTSAFSYKDKAAEVQDISREMGVRYVLEGSVRKADEQLRIIAQLIDATTGEHLWAERYDRPMKAIFTTLDEIARSIAITLRIQLTGYQLWDNGWYPRKSTDNAEAYEYYLRAFEYCCRLTKEANAKARELWEKAIALDSQYADAYALLASTYFKDFIFQWSRDPQILPRALVLAQTAVALNDAVPRAHWVLGSVHLFMKHYAQAIAAAERAIALDPNFADGYSGLAGILSSVGRPSEAVGLLEKAMRLNPRYPVTYAQELGRAYRLVGRREEAIATFKKALTLNPNYLFAHFQLAGIYSELGQEAEAQAEAAEVLRLNPNFSLEVWKQMIPFKDPTTIERWVVAARKAGLK